MNFEINKIYHGFKLIEEKKVSEINSIARLFYHEKSGAKLLNYENDDDNKVFAIGFRTPPENSTGLPHILEHSVLCGSRKFPTKEPFVDLLKGSLNTFLNAMTYSDKTLYPVASKNEKDFYNLMDVYLDAVLYPNIYKCPEIFMQEGWHYELENPEDEITYKGVVYNEMKGAFSSPEETLFRKIQESLFPDTSYRTESGGDPDVIPELSLEEFLSFHKKYYHPSNSYIYLYGDGNILNQLKFIDESYLKNFDKLSIASEIKFQKPFEKQREIVEEYPISMEEDEKDNTFLSINYATGKCIDSELYLAIEILEHMLLETPAAPLKKALIEAGLGKDVIGRVDNGILQPVFSVVVKNTNENEKERFQEVVTNCLKKLVENGIDKKLMEASINIIEFRLREADFHGFPKGLIYYIKCMESWLYDSNPSMHIEYENTLNSIKSKLKDGYFEGIIKGYLLNNNHRTIVIVKPKKGLGEIKANRIKEALRKFKETLNKEEIDKLIENTKKLKKRQVTPDLPEEVDKIPMVSIEDIKREVEELPLLEKQEAGVKVLFHPIFTNGIAYTNLYFDTSSVKEDLLPYLGLLSGVIGRIGTEKCSYGELSNEININTGGIDFTIEAYLNNADPDKYYPKFLVKAKSLSKKIPELYEILGEVLGKTDYNDKKRLKEIIREMKSRLEMVIFGRGHIVAGNHLLSYFSFGGRFNEITKGLDFYRFVSKLEKNFDSMEDEIVKSLQIVSNEVFNINNLMISYTNAQEDYSELTSNLMSILNNLSNKDIKAEEYNFKLAPENEGLLSQANVQYAAKGYNFIKLGYKYTGKLQVLKTIIGLDYLWNKVRIQGGAYGAFARFDRNGNMLAISYRDPNLKETLDVYDGVKEFIRDFDADSKEMTKYIIGTISEMDFPMTPAMKGERAAAYYISNITHEDRQRERDEVLSTTKADIKGFENMARDLMDKNFICVLGNEGKIKENKDIFKKLINIFE